MCLCAGTWVLQDTVAEMAKDILARQQGSEDDKALTAQQLYNFINRVGGCCRQGSNCLN